MLNGGGDAIMIILDKNIPVKDKHWVCIGIEHNRGEAYFQAHY